MDGVLQMHLLAAPILLKICCKNKQLRKRESQGRGCDSGAIPHAVSYWTPNRADPDAVSAGRGVPQREVRDCSPGGGGVRPEGQRGHAGRHVARYRKRLRLPGVAVGDADLVGCTRCSRRARVQGDEPGRRAYRRNGSQEPTDRKVFASQ